MRTKNVVVEKWNPKWKDEFERIVVSLGKDIIYNSIKIEHVGSTSVEGLSAKPIIDLDIVIENDKFEIIKRLLKDKGYEHEGNLGIEGREAFSYSGKEELMAHHLYVCPKDSKELFKHITFRDFLKNNPALASEYSKVKEQAAVLYPDDIDKYMEFKSEIIEKIYKRCGLLK
ncbi:GrpB family protein [Lachnoanaerobaculum gingivalis]|uniref:GrpB family protein n=1 Tax=Lachnoanaerobaculum gingivalis TaxID=2490855 RepID=A0A3P3QWW8_9FIRM|nr:GrpB family protein [Lachnoanaerobaculum gingivalis]RRJ25208.1 GrpB family protein [Lachnoanaerobaculum gingivalis]